jgi:hypothetical protein
MHALTDIATLGEHAAASPGHRAWLGYDINDQLVRAGMTLGITSDPSVVRAESIDGEAVDEAARLVPASVGQARDWLAAMARGTTVARRLKTARRVELTILIMRAGDELEVGTFELPTISDEALLDNILVDEQRLAIEPPAPRYHLPYTAHVYSSMQEADEDLADGTIDRSQWLLVRNALTESSVRGPSQGGGQ